MSPASGAPSQGPKPVHPTGSPGYLDLIAAPHRVCDDWVYGAAARLPGPSALWAVLAAVAVPAVTIALRGAGAPIEHVRGPTELTAPFLFAPVTLVYFLVMPLVFAAGLQCFDRLRPSMALGREEIAARRVNLRTPSARFQGTLLATALVVGLTTQEISSSRLSRFASGDWNLVDAWLVFAASLPQWAFLWMMGMTIYRAVVLARLIGSSVTPRLFDEDLGAPIAAFGIRAGFAFAVPYSITTLISTAIYEIDWFIILPGLVGVGISFAFTLIPGARLRQRIREVKQAEIDRVSARIEEREHVPWAEVSMLRELVGLLEYRREIRSMREWPFDLPMLRAFGFYFLLIPFTWLASALVEIAIARVAGG